MSKSHFAAGVYLFVVLNAAAQMSITTDPVGLTTTSCLARSDTYVSVPFTRPSEFIGTVRSTTANIITINGNPDWSNNQFVYAPSSQPKHYYVLIGNGGSTNPKEGHVYQITGNGPNTLLVDATSDNLTGIVANTQVILFPTGLLPRSFQRRMRVFPLRQRVRHQLIRRFYGFQTTLLPESISLTRQNTTLTAAHGVW